MSIWNFKWIHYISTQTYWTNYSNNLNYSIKYEICDIHMQSKFKKKNQLDYIYAYTSFL